MKTYAKKKYYYFSLVQKILIKNLKVNTMDLQNLSKAPDEMASILNKAYPHE